MKYLFIHLEIQDGERTHDHKILHTTSAKNICFAAQKYAASYWGDDTVKDPLSNNRWWAFNEITIKVESVQEISKEIYDVLNQFI